MAKDSASYSHGSHASFGSLRDDHPLKKNLLYFSCPQQARERRLNKHTNTIGSLCSATEAKGTPSPPRRTGHGDRHTTHAHTPFFSSFFLSVSSVLFLRQEPVDYLFSLHTQFLSWPLCAEHLFLSPPQVSYRSFTVKSLNIN